MKRPVFFLLLIVAVISSSCGGKRARAKTASELGEAVFDALRHKNAAEYLNYYPQLSEMKERLSDLEIDNLADPYNRSYYYSKDREREDISERTLERYFENDFAIPRENFNAVIEAGEDNDINWKKARFERAEIQSGTKASNYEHPAWIRLYGLTDEKSFCIILYNCLKGKKGWNSGLSMSFSKQVYDLHAKDDGN